MGVNMGIDNKVKTIYNSEINSSTGKPQKWMEILKLVGKLYRYVKGVSMEIAYNFIK